MSPLDRERLNMLASSAEDEAVTHMAHYETCRDCGQSIDLRRLGDVLHHDEPKHDPLPVH